jgi:hypothetical protein
MTEKPKNRQFNHEEHEVREVFQRGIGSFALTWSIGIYTSYSAPSPEHPQGHKGEGWDEGNVNT